MQSAEQLRREADATERMAAIVSYRPDKERLLRVAFDLRQRAELVQAREARSWKPNS